MSLPNLQHRNRRPEQIHGVQIRDARTRDAEGCDAEFGWARRILDEVLREAGRQNPCFIDPVYLRRATERIAYHLWERAGRQGNSEEHWWHAQQTVRHLLDRPVRRYQLFRIED